MIRTRLDSVVTLREREEDRAARELARAEAQVRVAQSKVEEARARAMVDERSRTDVSQWEVQELAQHRALTDEKRAQAELAKTQQVAVKTRHAYTHAHQKAEVVRRVAEARREELGREQARLETRQLDEVAAQLFVRKAG